MCGIYTIGANRGKCSSDISTDYRCGIFGVIPLSYIGTREVCSSYGPYASCVTQGPGGPGLPNADYLLFISASNSSSELCLPACMQNCSYVYDSPLQQCYNT